MQLEVEMSIGGPNPYLETEFGRQHGAVTRQLWCVPTFIEYRELLRVVARCLGVSTRADTNMGSNSSVDDLGFLPGSLSEAKKTVRANPLWPGAGSAGVLSSGVDSVRATEKPVTEKPITGPVTVPDSRRPKHSRRDSRHSLFLLRSHPRSSEDAVKSHDNLCAYCTGDGEEGVLRVEDVGNVLGHCGGRGSSLQGLLVVLVQAERLERRMKKRRDTKGDCLGEDVGKQSAPTVERDGNRYPGSLGGLDLVLLHNRKMEEVRAFLAETGENRNEYAVRAVEKGSSPHRGKGMDSDFQDKLSDLDSPILSELKRRTGTGNSTDGKTSPHLKQWVQSGAPPKSNSAWSSASPPPTQFMCLLSLLLDQILNEKE